LKENREEETSEGWIDWLRRTTHLAEEQLRRVSLDGWVQAQRRRKWRFAGHVARRDDERWSTTVAGWVPKQGYRARGHPKKRWTTDIDAYLNHALGVPSGFWLVVAGDREKWQRLENGFVNSSWY